MSMFLLGVFTAYLPSFAVVGFILLMGRWQTGERLSISASAQAQQVQ
jgi:hypothetical protein